MSELLPPPKENGSGNLPDQMQAWRSLQGEGEPELEQVDFKELLATVRRRWKLVLLVTLASVGAAWYLAMSEPAHFQAMATIRLADTRRQMTNGIDQTQTVYGGIAMFADPILSQIQVLDSRAVAMEVVKQHPLGLRVIPVGIGAKSLDDVSVISEPIADTIHLAIKGGIVTATAGMARVRAPLDSLIRIGGIAFSVKSDPRPRTRCW